MNNSAHEINADRHFIAVFHFLAFVSNRNIKIKIQIFTIVKYLILASNYFCHCEIQDFASSNLGDFSFLYHGNHAHKIFHANLMSPVYMKNCQNLIQ